MHDRLAPYLKAAIGAIIADSPAHILIRLVQATTLGSNNGRWSGQHLLESIAFVCVNLRRLTTKKPLARSYKADFYSAGQKTLGVCERH